MSIIDFHSHIIPGIDDGSQNIKMTLEMLEEECEQRVETVIATPHFYAHRKSIEDFLEKRNAALADLRDTLNQEFPQIRTGAEVYYFQGMGKAERLPDLCIEGTNTILVEMPFAQWTEHIYRDIREIITGRHMNVVLAHIERYPEFQRDHGPWDMIMSLPLTTQINAGSFIKGRRRRKFCIDWIKNRPASVLGSDCHNLDTRQPNLAPAREIIRKKAGAEVLERIDETVAELLGM
jgi:protein-tyrosine phosphatase